MTPRQLGLGHDAIFLGAEPLAIQIADDPVKRGLLIPPDPEDRLPKTLSQQTTAGVGGGKRPLRQSRRRKPHPLRRGLRGIAGPEQIDAGGLGGQRRMGMGGTEDGAGAQRVEVQPQRCDQTVHRRPKHP
ncbi:hypothetical protein C8J30_101126 [Rhodobacter viridis]|uniref:Uncharacterized protein n=2 Tax=Rhodobacter viridis TaxID=1054202 RepID=A0A318UGQ4_9RHOB|nr:hypothetical protein C8J30_101126 [Rhodobacter viridis]